MSGFFLKFLLISSRKILFSVDNSGLLLSGVSQNVLSSISRGCLVQLFGVGESLITSWFLQGCNKDGRPLYNTKVLHTLMSILRCWNPRHTSQPQSILIAIKVRSVHRDGQFSDQECGVHTVRLCRRATRFGTGNLSGQAQCH